MQTYLRPPWELTVSGDLRPPPPGRTTDPDLRPGRATIMFPPLPLPLKHFEDVDAQTGRERHHKAKKGTCSLDLGVEASLDIIGGFFFYCLSLSLNYICSPPPKNIAWDD